MQKLKRRLLNRRGFSAILGAAFVCVLLAVVYTILVIPKEVIPFDPGKMKVEIVGRDSHLSYQEETVGSFFCPSGQSQGWKPGKRSGTGVSGKESVVCLYTAFPEEMALAWHS